ncbi:SDR family NAD(P)-dependent oxidoreductase [Novosphingobium mangrovi (ex Huang et al. 2023)]|uniref:Glucose 1-dehydrogenase n=1 Tax=Novosphingobium mangrovi (ex Huang et al. 2023) TaxID=2976432 RepID=A0ABT2I533_9SPHN|nr:glucose 1-dehydrogenase [Novosphingobium mangrovi (ex Huang et al. 2023)]MCT2399920.1 glucose 1-dehydrogenase [Novosphingobium mangrovi (ex Huang et al. 2023)]
MTERFRLDGRVAIVTGAAAGIGRVAARALAEAGAAVAMADRDGEALQQAAADLRASGASILAVEGDIASASGPEELVEATVGAFGRLDILVNNAGIYPHGPRLPEVDWEIIERTYAVDLMAPLRCISEAARRMTPGSAIVNVSSMESLRPSGPGNAHYSSAKAALNAVTRAAAVDLGPLGVRVNAVLPGLIHTEGTSHVPEAFLQHVAGRTPCGRIGEPDDIASAIVFLASPAATYVNGQCLVVDGGITIAG